MIQKYQLSGFAKWYMGKTILITGATSGIGREFARQLNECGAKLVLCGQDQNAMDSLVNELNVTAVYPIIAILGNLSEKSTVRKIINQSHETDVLINNAGFGCMNDFHSTPEEKNSAMVEVNCLAVTELCREFIPRMAGREGTGILNVGSLASFFPTPGSALYGATKHFILGFTSALHQELLPLKINVTGVYPGVTESKFHLRASGGKIENALNAMPAKQVVSAALKGLSGNKLIIIPGLSNRIKLLIASLMPRKLQLEISYSNSQRRAESGPNSSSQTPCVLSNK